jgi:iron-sulfur cluster assembly protein
VITQPIDITDRAMDQIRKIMQEKRIPDFYGLRVGIQGRGCMGATTKLLGFDTKNERDLEYVFQGIPLYLDKSQAMFLVGTTLDYYFDGEEEGFIFLDKSAP